jgi:hypothetical protein
MLSKAEKSSIDCTFDTDFDGIKLSPQEAEIFSVFERSIRLDVKISYVFEQVWIGLPQKPIRYMQNRIGRPVARINKKLERMGSKYSIVPGEARASYVLRLRDAN